MNDRSKPVILVVDNEPDIVTILQAGLRCFGLCIGGSIGGLT